MVDHNVAWAAGFLEGEGYIGFKTRIHKPNGRSYSRLVINLAQVFREPLDVFQSIFKVGSVSGPFGPYSTNKQPYYQYNAHGNDAEMIINQVLPYLFAKGIQAKEALDRYKDYNGPHTIA